VKIIKKVNREAYFVFSSQAELGGRGARVVTLALEPDLCIVLDLEVAWDYIGGKGNLKLGKGPIVTVIDKGLIMHHEVKEHLENPAKEKTIELLKGLL